MKGVKELGRKAGATLRLHPQKENTEIAVVSGKKPVKPQSCQIPSCCSYF